MIDLTQCYLEEDMFPKLFAPYVERPYGVLFCNPINRDSYDSNHAVIYRDKISDLKAVLEDITEYYRERGQTPIIYQSMLDDGWFEEIKDELTAAGYRSWSESQKYMLPLAENMINPNPEIEVRKLDTWDDSLTQVFLEAEEPWEIEVAKTEAGKHGVWFFAAFFLGKPVGVTYGHCTDKVCRGDYILVSKNYRRLGVGRALFWNVVEWTKVNGIDNFYLWPDGESPERIYTEGGFRFVELRTAGRAVYEGTERRGLPAREQA